MKTCLSIVGMRSCLSRPHCLRPQRVVGSGSSEGHLWHGSIGSASTVPYERYGFEAGAACHAVEVLERRSKKGKRLFPATGRSPGQEALPFA